jgi:hypothetical protein
LFGRFVRTRLFGCQGYAKIAIVNKDLSILRANLGKQRVLFATRSISARKEDIMLRVRWLLALLLGCLLGTALTAGASGSAAPAQIGPQAATGSGFTYQGRLTDGGNPANGVYDLQFILYDAAIGGAQVGPTITSDDVTVASGLFTVNLDFGSVYNSTSLFLDIAVRPGANTGTYTQLAPRQPLTPTPYAAGLVLPYTGTASSSGTLFDLSNNGTGQAAELRSASSFVTLFASNSGSGGAIRADTGNTGQGSAVTGYNYGTDRYAAEFEIIKNTNPRAAIYARTAGTGQAIDAEVNSATTADALFARTTSPTAGSYAGVFSGPVQISCSAATCNTTNALQVVGNFAATAKTFKIDHPLDPANKYLYHSSVESPDMKNIYDGVVTTDSSGFATVVLPDYFEALNRDFRYQLTVLGAFAQAIIKDEIQSNQFTIQTDAPNIKVSWQVTGIRHDAYADAHPMQVEQDKPADERGRYLEPQAFGKPGTLGIDVPAHSNAVPIQPTVQPR